MTRVSDPTELVVGVDERELSDVVRSVLDDPRARLRSWESHPLTVISGFGPYRALFRVSGEAESGSRARHWSVVRKVVRRPPHARDQASHPNFWKREFEAYGSKLLQTIRGVRPARCHGRSEPDSETFVLWLEDVVDEYPNGWPVARYGLAAYHLGSMAAAHAMQGSGPLPAWMFDAREDEALATRFRSRALDPETWKRSEVARVFSHRTLEVLKRQWACRDAFLGSLKEAPSVLSHNDAHAQNLFSMRGRDGTPETVAIDWELLGLRPVAHDLTHLVIASIRRFEVSPNDVDVLEEAVLDGYLAGLEDSGWSIDPVVVRRTFSISVALRGGLVPQILALLTNPSVRAHQERVWRRTSDELIERWVVAAEFVLGHVERARSML